MEVWRYDGKRLEFLRRQSASSYAPIERSMSFPELPLEQVNRLIEVGLKEGQSAAVRELRKWLKLA